MLRLLSKPDHRRHLPSLLGRRAASGSGGESNRDPTDPPRLFVVQPRLRPDSVLEPKLNEALCLANSLEEQREGFFTTDFFDKGLPPHAVVQNPSARGRRARADTYFGTGTVDNVKCHLNEAETKGEVDAVFVNAILSGVQQRNLERIWGKPVLDRVGLIIEIFNAHAFTKEAKLQAELAALMYKKTRLVRVRGLDGRFAFGVGGEAEVVSARGRGSGGRGFISGAGETELQLQRRRILERRSHLLLQIEEVRRTRSLQRAARKRHDGTDGLGLATVAVVGYTNAGKSTLVGELSQTDLYSDDRLFATVDPRLRSVILPSGYPSFRLVLFAFEHGRIPSVSEMNAALSLFNLADGHLFLRRKVLLSDTVGFISDLPVQLVEAFHATLEEVVEADLLVHILDSSAPNLEDHRSTVLQVLEQIGVSEEKIRDMIEVWNKIDLQDELDPKEEEHHLDAENDEPKDDLEVEDEMTLSSKVEDEDDIDENYRDGHEIAIEFDEGGDCLNEYTAAFDYTSAGPSKAADICSSFAQDGPHVRTSAVTGVGLQELLEVIDEKLTFRDKKFKADKVVEQSTFYKKWRPPLRTDDATTVAT